VSKFKKGDKVIVHPRGLDALFDRDWIGYIDVVGDSLDDVFLRQRECLVQHLAGDYWSWEKEEDIGLYHGDELSYRPATLFPEDSFGV
jgi:hypothetical protein